MVAVGSTFVTGQEAKKEILADMLPPRQVYTNRITVLTAVLVAFAAKAALAVGTIGTNDVISWQLFLRKILADGGLALYRDVPDFIHPPFIIHLLTLFGSLEGRGVPLQVSMRLACSVADAGTAWILYKMATRSGSLIWPTSLLLAILSPVSILVSGFHGNTDPIMMLLVAASVYAAEQGTPPWLAGAFLGAAMNIKIVPILLVPSLFFWFEGARRRLAFATGVAAAFIAGSMPYLALAPKLVLTKVLGYAGTLPSWGWSLVPSHLAARAGIARSYDRIEHLAVTALLVALLGLSIWMNRGRSKPPPMLQCGLVLFIFLAVCPGFSTQYLDWLVVWTVVLSPGLSAAFHLAAGSTLFAVYNFWAGGLPWRLANAWNAGKRPAYVIVMIQATWLIVSLVAYKLYLEVTAGKGRDTGKSQLEVP